MAAITGTDFLGALKATNLLNGATNINTNSGSAGFDVSNYTGTLAILLSCGPGVSGSRP